MDSQDILGSVSLPTLPPAQSVASITSAIGSVSSGVQSSIASVSASAGSLVSAIGSTDSLPGFSLSPAYSTPSDTISGGMSFKKALYSSPATSSTTSSSSVFSSLGSSLSSVAGSLTQVAGQVIGNASVSTPLGTVSVGSNGNVSGSVNIGGVNISGSTSGGISTSVSGSLGTVSVGSNGSVFGSLGVGGVRVTGSNTSLSGSVNLGGGVTMSASALTGALGSATGALSAALSKTFSSVFGSPSSGSTAGTSTSSPVNMGPLGSEANSVGSFLSDQVSDSLTAFSNPSSSGSSLSRTVASLANQGIPLNANNLSTALGYNKTDSPDGTSSSGLDNMTGSVLIDLSSGLSSGNNEPNAFTSAHTLQKVLARGDPILNYEWVAVLVDPRNPIVIDPIYIETLSTPQVSFDQKVVFRDGSNYNYAGTKSVGQMTIGLHMDSTGRAMKVATSWIESVYNSPTGTFLTPSDYKKTVKLFVHDATRGVVACFYFMGVWPISWNPNNWDQTQEHSVLNLTLSVDRMYVVGGQPETVRVNELR